MYRRSQQTDSDWSFVVDVVKIALGVFVGSLMAVFVYEAVLEYRLESAARRFGEQQRFEADRVNAANALQNQRAAAAREEERTRENNLRSAQALANRLERERQQRKQVAWEAFFQPTPVCKADPTSFGCANAHMAARKQFDSQYVDR